jgi:hypothetical protein
MTHPGGGFYSTQDADSEGEEGKFFVWTPDEIKALLGEKEGQVFCAAYDVTLEPGSAPSSWCSCIRSSRGACPPRRPPNWKVARPRRDSRSLGLAGTASS